MFTVTWVPDFPDDTPHVGKVVVFIPNPSSFLGLDGSTTVGNVEGVIDTAGELKAKGGTTPLALKWLSGLQYQVRILGAGLAPFWFDVETHVADGGTLDLSTVVPSAGAALVPTQYAELSARMLVVVGSFTLPSSPALGRSLTVLADSSTVLPTGITWDSGGAPTITGRLLLSFVWSGSDWVGTYGLPFAAAPDTTAPAWTATLTTGTPTSSSVVVSASALATDAVGVTGYEVSIDSGVTWVAITPSGLNFTISGLTASTSYPAPQFRANDAAGNYSTVLSAQAFTTDAAAGDTTPPTAGTLAGSAITDTSFTLTVTGAADETALDAAPYAFSTDNGATWSAYQAAATYNATGLTASTAYTCQHRVRDAAGNVSTGTAITVTTGAPVTPLTLAWVADGAQVNAPGTSYTWTGLGIGTASATRRVAVLVASYKNATPTSYITGLTIGGVTAIRDAATPDTAIRTLEVWTANVPTGTTADVAVTFASTPDYAVASTFVIDGGASTPGASNVAFGSTVNNATASVASADGGVVLAVSSVVASAQTVTWTGDVTLEHTVSSANLTRSAAKVSTTNATAKTATATWSGINPTVVALAVVPA